MLQLPVYVRPELTANPALLVRRFQWSGLRRQLTPLDYPVGQDTIADSWGMWNRECVSYTAWKVYQTYGYMPYWGGVGNANQWPGDAQAAHIPTGSTPRVHSVAISMGGAFGHATYVESVNGNSIIYI